MTEQRPLTDEIIDQIQMKRFTGPLIVLGFIVAFQISQAIHAHQQGIRLAEAVCEAYQRGDNQAQVLRVAERFTYVKYMEYFASKSFKATIKACPPTRNVFTANYS